MFSSLYCSNGNGSVDAQYISSTFVHFSCSLLFLFSGFMSPALYTFTLFLQSALSFH